VRVTALGKLIGGTPKIKRAGGLKIRHEHAFLRIQDLRGLAHETHPGHDQGWGGMVMAKARHLE
jgi:hypothetical protein